jgi:hypothetical protein
MIDKRDAEAGFYMIIGLSWFLNFISVLLVWSAAPSDWTNSLLAFTQGSSV